MIIYIQKNIQCILCILYIQDTFIQEYGPPDVPPLSIQCENQERRYNETNGNSNQDHQPTFFSKINIDEVKTKDINQLFQYGYYQVKIQPTCCCYIRLQVDSWMGVKTPGSVIYQSHISIYHIYVKYYSGKGVLVM